jgi:hypothetical protein
MAYFLNNKQKVYFIFFILLIFISASFVHTAAGEENMTINIGEGDTWHYFKGTVEPPRNWTQIGFDDSSWEKGRAGFGYGPGKHNTLLSDMRGKYKSIYVRKDFIVTDYRKIASLNLSLICDGPFIAYLDGIEALRSRRRQTGESYDLSGFAHELDHHTNVIAIKCSNDDINSDDFSFTPSFQLDEKEGQHQHQH